MEIIEASQKSNKSVEDRKVVQQVDEEEDDLEDGEIETDEDDDEPIITAVFPADRNHDTIAIKKKLLTASSTMTGGGGGDTVALIGATLSPTVEKKSGKFKRPEVVDDDWAGNIENAIAAALKKDGIEPPIPKLDKQRLSALPLDDHDRMSDRAPDHNDEIRKKRKRRNRDDKEKSRSKRMKHAEQQHDHSNKHEPVDYDESEMLCVRGGSPEPMAVGPGSHQISHHHHHHRRSPSPPIPTSGFYDSDDSYSSYDSYDSSDNRKASHDERRQTRRAKDRRQQRKFADSASGGGGGGRSGGGGGGSGTQGGGSSGKRRNRHDSDGVCIPNMRGRCNDGDDCTRSHDSRSQRKLELCKFYLMDCCAKKDKCSYMHGDFPCKYYYLGMECVYKAACKFSHGKPLTEQLRNILLKHIETAPKEILGNFRRISREHATGLLLTTHAKLCVEHDVENTMEPAPLTMSFSRQSRSPSEHRTGNPFGTPSSSASSLSLDPGIIPPSLLDMQIVKPSLVSPRKDDKEKSNSIAAQSHKNDKPRKSRWCDFAASTGSSAPASALSHQQHHQPVASPTHNISHSGLNLNWSSATEQSDILSLKNLKGVITPEQIDQLSAIGIENLEQISQLTVAQLNNVGLTISQINEIQLNAMNIQKLGLISSSGTASGTVTVPSSNSGSSTSVSISSSSVNVPTSTTSSTAVFSDDNQTLNSAASQDVDMRFLVGAVQASSTQQPQSSSTATASSLRDIGIASPEPISNSAKPFTGLLIEQETAAPSNNVTVDFTQYLKDSNLDADKTDFNNLLTDDKDDDDALNEDEPELLIDESRCASDDEPDLPNQSLTSDKDSEELEPKPMPAIYDPKLLLPPTTKFNVNTTSSDDLWNSNGRGVTDRGRPGGGKSDRSEYGGRNEDKRGGDDYRNESRESYYGSGGRSDYYGSRDDDYCSGGGGASGRSEFSGDYTSLCDEKNRDSYRSTAKPPTDQYRDPRLGGHFSKKPPKKPPPPSVPSAPVDNYDGDWDTEEEKDGDNDDDYEQQNRKQAETMCAPAVQHQVVIPPVIVQASPPPKYFRASIYDGRALRNGGDDGKDNDDDDSSQDDDERYGREGNSSSDRDMRLSFLDTGDIDLRLPFKPVMTNYTPATEIDGSISSHAPITYKVYDVAIPRPDYSEIRRTVTVTEKTLDPRLRRIFCLKESLGDSYGSDSEPLRSPPQTVSGLMLPGAKPSSSDASLISSLGGGGSTVGLGSSTGGPRIDPRRRKESQSSASSLLPPPMSARAATSTTGVGQNVDIRLLLQKSHWYKNLNSKFKIMVNQQLALVSTELKKFHQDTTPDKVFDMKFLATNQYLQQVLTNLGIFIDGNGQILQLDGDGDDTMMGGGGMMMSAGGGGGGGMMVDAPPMGMSGMDFMRPQQPGMAINPRFMGGGMMGSFGPRFGDIRPGLLGVAPGINPYNPFEGAGSATPNDQFGGFNNDDYNSGNKSGGNDQGPGFGGGGGNSNNPFDQGPGGKFYSGRHDGNDGPADNIAGRQSGNRGNRNFRQGNTRNNSNDRWGGGGGGQGRSGPGRNNRNYENNRGGGGRRDKQK